MGINPTFNKNKITKAIQAKFSNVDKSIIQALKRLGEQAVRVARETGDYIDQTGNLRSSIGYIILIDGKINNQDFQSSTKDENGTGIKTGLQYALEISKKYQSGYVLIVVAGMNYAAAVESKSRDVLTSAEKFAEKEMPKIIKRLKLGINKVA